MKYSCNACGRYVEGSCDCYRPTMSDEEYLRKENAELKQEVERLKRLVADWSGQR